MLPVTIVYALCCFAVDRRGAHIACVGVLTDCDADELIRFEKGSKISLDEVLKAHVELRK
jgi:hypothetical protein